MPRLSTSTKIYALKNTTLLFMTTTPLSHDPVKELPGRPTPPWQSKHYTTPDRAKVLGAIEFDEREDVELNSDTTLHSKHRVPGDGETRTHHNRKGVN